MNIHKTAIVSSKAKLAQGLIVGPYAIIEEGVSIGPNTKIGAHCLITGNTTIGSACEVFTGAIIGSRPQDLKYKGEKSYLEIGDENIIREYCTFNSGTAEDGGKTIVGNNNLFMAYAHVAHDCVVGDNCVVANNGTLAGHVSVEDKAVVGGLAAVHQFVRVGRLSIIGGCSKVVQDVPPYSTCDGHPARLYGLNLVGLRRDKFPKETIQSLNHAFKILFSEGLSLKHSLEKIEKEMPQNKEVQYLINFMKNSERGIVSSCRKEK